MNYQPPKQITDDVNNANVVGDYNVSYQALNKPTNEWLALKVIGNGSDFAQIAIGLNSGATYSRAYNSANGWTTWKRLDNE